MAQNNSGKRGFAAMDEEKRREIARKGGRNSHSGGSSHATNQARSSGRGNQSQRGRNE